MKLFIDTANLKDIESALRRGCFEGVTTNPSLLAKEPRAKFEDHVGKIIELVRKHTYGMHVSVEVFSTDPEEILRQARHFMDVLDYPYLSIKVQIGWNELEIIHRLSKEGISVNCTACMTVSQGIMAALAGARYVSFFWGRIKDGATDPKFEKERNGLLESRVIAQDDFDPAEVIRKTREFIDARKLKTEIIAGSMRGVKDIIDAGVAGAHIVTIPPKFFPAMASHYKTDEVVEQFLGDFKGWLT